MMGKAKTDRRDEGCCGIFFLKYVLIIFNIIFWLSGVAVLGVGLWTWLTKSGYIYLLGSGTFMATVYILIITGGVVILMGFLGCIGAVMEHRWLLMTYGFFLMIIFLLEALAGILAFIYASTIHVELMRTFNNTITLKYMYDPDVTLSTDLLHVTFKCCGTRSYEDWKYGKWIRDKTLNTEKNKVPDSCCKTPSRWCGVRDHPSNIQYDGCLNQLEVYVKSHLLILGSVGLGICFLQIFGIIVACCLARQLKVWKYKQCQQQVEYPPSSATTTTARNSYHGGAYMT